MPYFEGSLVGVSDMTIFFVKFNFDKNTVLLTDSKCKRGIIELMQVGHDSRRKLCIVGFNWNSSQFRLNKLSAAGKSSSSVANIDARVKLKDR